MSGSRFLRNSGVTGGAPWAPVLLLLAVAALLAGLCTPARAAEDKKEKPKKPAAKAKPLTVEQLAGLNGVALFGVPVKINKGRFTLIYPGAGEFDKGFTSQNPVRKKNAARWCAPLSPPAAIAEEPRPRRGAG